ncbi:hypothetical protein [Pararhizobium qamdonense]|uniref:hypothetical protein n=1 Tax=Pararhizobium qamdonense TaxID=3031126 RepID=UPI0023E13DE2|nr:hypothetical protein [Pararhizobium qamdonense]
MTRAISFNAYDMKFYVAKPIPGLSVRFCGTFWNYVNLENWPDFVRVLDRCIFTSAITFIVTELQKFGVAPAADRAGRLCNRLLGDEPLFPVSKSDGEVCVDAAGTASKRAKG